MTHTKGRLALSHRGTPVIRTENQTRRIAYTEPADAPYDERFANAARIVALWNAAEELGLTTEAIEAGAIQAAFDDQAALKEAAEEAAWNDAIRFLTEPTS